MAPLVALALALPGCVVVRGHSGSGVLLGGGSIGLFILIFVAALLFGKRH